LVYFGIECWRTLTRPSIILVLRWSSFAFGQSEIAERAPSVLFGILTVCAAAILPGASLSRGSRVALPLVLAVSPGAVWYAREARSYALLLLLSTVITVAGIRLLRCMPYEASKERAALTMLHGRGVARLLHALLRLPPHDGDVFHLFSSGGQPVQSDHRPFW
jgi:hypothetical protein